MPPLHGGRPRPPNSSFLVYLVSGMGGLAAPLFVTVFGWGCVRTHLSQSQRIKRGVFFIAAQTGVNLSAPHLFDPFSPGVLTLFGLLILLQPLWLVPATKKPNRSHLPFLTILGFSLFLTIFLSQWQGSIEWSARNETSSASQWIHHALLTGTYPVLPWVVFASLGAWIGCQEGKQITFPQNNTNLGFGSARPCELRIIIHIRMVNRSTVGIANGQGASDVLPCKCDVLDRRTDGRLLALVEHTEHPS